MKASTMSCESCGKKPMELTESWRPALESADIFCRSLKLGRFRGVAGITSCLHSGQEGSTAYAELVRELIKRDILVTISGCSPLEIAEILGDDPLLYAGEGLSEFCEHLDLNPVLYTGINKDGRETLEFYGRVAHHAAAVPQDLPTASLVYDGKKDPLSTADFLDGQIHDKRLSLEWHDRYHCSMESYS